LQSFEPKEYNSLKSICEKYSEVLKNWLEKEEENSSMNNILRSNELLLYWICTCLLFHSLKFEINLLHKNSIPLDWRNLSFLVLDSKKSTESMLIISNYLQSTLTDNPLFSLESQRGTLNFASAFSKESKLIMNQYSNELKEIKRKEDDHQRLIDLQLEELKILRDNFKNTKEERDAQYNLYCDSQSNSYQERFYKKSYSELNQKMSNISSSISRKKIPPKFIIHPIPKNLENALEVLFFLMMPENLNIFSWFCYQSQMKLVAKKPCNRSQEIDSLEEYLNVSKENFYWKDHYTKYSSSFLQTSNSFYQLSTKDDIPKSYGPSDIEFISSVSECSWYPGINDNLFKSCTLINPFSVNLKRTSLYFSEKIPIKCLQWAVDPPEDNILESIRGNEVFCRNISTDELSRQAIYHFCMLRAFPNLQFLKILQCIQDNLLPFENESVQILIYQSLFQIGQLVVDENCVFPKWRHDLMKNDGFISFLKNLQQFSENIASKFRDHQSMVLLSELTCFVAQY
jgi:hypothetical protein